MDASPAIAGQPAPSFLQDRKHNSEQRHPIIHQWEYGDACEKVESIGRRSSGMSAQPVTILCVTDRPLTGPAAARSLHEFPLLSPSHVFGVVSEVKRLSLL